MHNPAVGLLILRLMVGGLMLFHGIAKFNHAEASLNFIGGALAGYGLPSFLAYGVFLGEIVAPVMIIIGVLSRYASIVVVINMIFAILLMHTGDFFDLTEHGGWRLELQAFYLFGALAIVFMGSGPHAVKAD